LLVSDIGSLHQEFLDDVLGAIDDVVEVVE
jgi:hypothetical protein